VGEDEDLAHSLDDLPQLEGLGQVEGHRLVADDVESGLQKQPGRTVVLVVGGDDDDKVEALLRGQGRFGLGHFAVGPVDARRIEEKVGARGLGADRVAGKRAGDQLGPAVHRGGDAVHAPDEGAPPPADHSES
jgi:hypothetical protein